LCAASFIALTFSMPPPGDKRTFGQLKQKKMVSLSKKDYLEAERANSSNKQVEIRS
jgi:hypothetical protein